MISIKKKHSRFAVIVLLLQTHAFPIKAELSDVLDRGLQMFNQGQYLQAVKEFETAALLAQQMHSNSLEAKLRKIDPIEGWDKRPFAGRSANGMFAVEFIKLNSAISIEITGAPNLRESVAMMITNPLLASANGGSIRQINGQSGLLKFDDAELKGDFQFALETMLVTIRGTGITEQELIDYAIKIPFREL